MGIGRRTRLGKLRWFVRDAQFSTACEKVQRYADKSLQAALSVEPATVKRNRYIFLHEMVKQLSDHNFIRNNLLAVYVAGHESTAILCLLLQGVLMCWTSFDRKHYPFKTSLSPLNFSKANVTYTKSLTRVSFVSCWYLPQLTKAPALRLYPLLVQSTRVALQDTVLPTGGGKSGRCPIMVKKGWSVVYNPFALHRRKDIYGEDAEQFKPERWDSLRQNWHYLPFGGGPRICPAQQLALTEASYSLFRILLLFKENRSCDDRPWTEAIKLTVRNKNGTKIALIPA